MQYSLRHLLAAVTLVALALAFPAVMWMCLRVLLIYAPILGTIGLGCFMSGHWQRTLVILLCAAAIGIWVVPAATPGEQRVIGDFLSRLLRNGSVGGFVALIGIAEYLSAAWVSLRGS